MPDFVITPFTSADVDAVLAIWNRALRRDSIDAGRFCAWLFGDTDYRPGNDSGFFVARRGISVVGFLRAIVRRTPNERIGLEPDSGWIPVFAVDPLAQRQGVGAALLHRSLDWLRAGQRKQIWICGGTGSAPGYVFPGVDLDAYPAAYRLLIKSGFIDDHHAAAMARGTFDFDVDTFAKQAWEKGGDLVVETLSLQHVDAFLEFLAVEFPGDWTTAARSKLRSNRLHEVLIARRGDTVVGYCQWEAEHFGPFGVATSARNERVGAKLFVEAVRRIRAADGRSVWFNWADPDAERFYARFGLKPTRRFAIMKKVESLE